MTRYLLTITDTHAGNRLALCNPDCVLTDEDAHGSLRPWKPSLSHMQVYLWRVYQQDVAAVVEHVGHDELIVTHAGDSTQGLRHQEHLMTTRLSDQIQIAEANMAPLLALPNVKRVRILKGTNGHSFGEGSAEALLAALLQARHPALDVECLYHGRFNVDGVWFDISHHGPSGGTRLHVEGNAARNYLRDRLTREVLTGQEPTRVIVRGHHHVWTHESVELETKTGDVTCDLVIVPGYVGIGEYERKRLQSLPIQTHGMCLFRVDDGRLEVIPLKRTVDLRTEEIL